VTIQQHEYIANSNGAFLIIITVKYIIVFEKDKLHCYLTFDCDKCVYPTQLTLSSSTYDSENNKNTHILVVTDP
jgi:hypothetical protein